MFFSAPWDVLTVKVHMYAMLFCQDIIENTKDPKQPCRLEKLSGYLLIFFTYKFNDFLDLFKTSKNKD